MREYETTAIVQPEISDEGIQTLYGRVDGLLERGGAVRLLYDDQGKRRLAYEIQKFQKGRYIVFSYLDGGSVVPELERALRIDDSVLRFLTVQVNDDVEDVEARKVAAAEQERIQAQKAAERAAREAEEAAAAAAARKEAEDASDEGDEDAEDSDEVEDEEETDEEED